MSIIVRCKKCDFNIDNPTFEDCYKHCWRKNGVPIEERDPDAPPPIGIMPRAIWEANRKRDIVDAMKRYVDAGVHIPDAWINELHDLEYRF